MSTPFPVSPNDAYLKVQQSAPGPDGPACVLFKKQPNGTHAPVLAMAEDQFNQLLAAMGAVPTTPTTSGGGTSASSGTTGGVVTIEPTQLSTLATAANQLLEYDRIVRESARTQNIMAEMSADLAPTHVTSYSLMDQYTATDVRSRLAPGDIFLCVTDYSVIIDQTKGSEQWTTKGAQHWIRIFNSATSSTVHEVLDTAPDTSFATQDASGVCIKKTFERALVRRVIDSSLVESLATVTETRTVQASHIYPYLSIYDSGWV